MQMQTHSQNQTLQRVAKVWTARAWNLERERAHRAYHRFAMAIAIDAADGKRVGSAVRDFFGDPKARLSAALRTMGKDPDIAEAFALRNRVNLWDDAYDPVVWYPKPKTSGGYRPICILPPALKAAHYMLAAVIGALLPDTSTLYGIPRRGVADALRELKTLQNGGFVHLATADIVNCFQSIDPDALYQLPLPTEVIRHALDYRNLTITGEPRDDASQVFASLSSPVYGVSHWAGGPTGLLQGSPASGIILAWLLKDIPTSDDARVMLCFDNIVVAARTPEGSRGMMTTLAAYCRNSPAGPLAMCDPTFADEQPMEFLGGLFDPDRRDIGIAHDTIRRIERRLIAAEAADHEDLSRILEEYHRRVAISPLCRVPNPYEHHYPGQIWHTLRDAAAGMSFLEADCPELLYLLETGAMSVERRADGMTNFLHRNLFAPPDKRTATLLRHILRTHPRPPKQKR